MRCSSVRSTAPSAGVPPRASRPPPALWPAASKRAERALHDQVEGFKLRELSAARDHAAASSALEHSRKELAALTKENADAHNSLSTVLLELAKEKSERAQEQANFAAKVERLGQLLVKQESAAGGGEGAAAEAPADGAMAP